MKDILSLAADSDSSLVDRDRDISDTVSEPTPKVEVDPNAAPDDPSVLFLSGIPFETIRSNGLYRSSYSINFV